MKKYPSDSINRNRQTLKQDEAKNESAILLNYYELLGLHHPDLIIILSRDGRILSKNYERINNLLGYKSTERLNYNNIISAETMKTLTDCFNESLKGTTIQSNVKVKDDDGNKLFLNITFIPISNTLNELPSVHAIIRNQTSYYQLVNELETKATHLNHAQQIANIGSWQYDVLEDKLLWSDNSYDMFGYNRKTELTLENVYGYTHPDDFDKLISHIEHTLRTGEGYQIEYRIVNGETNEIHFIKEQTEALFESGKVTKLIGVMNDITTERKLQRELSEGKAQYNYIFNNLQAGIWLQNFQSKELYFLSDGIAELYEYPLNDLYNNTFLEEYIHPDDRHEANLKLEQLNEGLVCHHEYRIICRNGTVKWISAQIIPWLDDDGKVFRVFGLQTDITEKMELQQEIEFQATHDIITRLPNQMSLFNKINDCCSDKSLHTFVLLYMEVDHLNRINNSLGYDIGDKVVQHATKRLVKTLPQSSYLSRINHNNFAAIITDYTSKQHIFDLSEHIIRTFEKPIIINEYELYIVTSIGISFYPDDGNSKETLLESAHAAVFHAKQRRKSMLPYYSYSKDISAYKTISLEKDMRNAIQNNEFELHYQPLVNPVTGKIEEAEALIRWHHGEWGLISPAEFISLAEENHYIHDIGEWVIHTACAQLRTWIDQGLPITPISINISPIQFLKKDLANTVVEIIQKHDIPSKLITLEITENTPLKLDKKILFSLNQLQQSGIKIALDDFGTGFASFNYLHHFQADTIKIDQLFIQNIQGKKKQDFAIVSSVLHLAKLLNIKIVAEGVEKMEQLALLKEIDCNLIQGYIFSKPVPPAIFKKLLKKEYLLPKV